MYGASIQIDGRGFGSGTSSAAGEAETPSACQPQQRHRQPRGASIGRYYWVYVRCHETWTTPVQLDLNETIARSGAVANLSPDWRGAPVQM